MLALLRAVVLGQPLTLVDSDLSEDELQEVGVTAEAVAEFRRLKGLCDPDGILETNLYRRLFGAGEGASSAPTISTNR